MRRRAGDGCRLGERGRRMQIAGVEAYVNHPVLHLGATDWVPVSLDLGAADAASCDTHVAVRVLPQSDLIRVRIFRDSADGSGLDLLPLLSALNPPTPVLIFSAHEVDDPIAGRVASVLIKSRTSDRQLLENVHAILGARPG